MKTILIIFRKELMDALRDRRTLTVVLVMSLIMMPFMMITMSEATNRFESHAEKKQVIVDGISNAPQLENYLARQGYTVKTAPPDYEKKLQDKELTDPVLVIGTDFDSKLSRGERPKVDIVLDLGNQDTRTGVAPIRHLLQGFGMELAGLNLAMRGVSPDILNVVEVREKLLSRGEEPGAQLKGLLAMMLLVTMVSAGLHAAIDTSAGERERGSLEPLMMTPVPSLYVALGKWLAVGALTIMVVIFNVLSIVPASALVRNESVRIMLQFTGGELAIMIGVLAPLGLLLAALQIAIAINGKSYKEAQARCTLLTLFAPVVSMVTMFKQGADPAWFKWVPLLAQNQLITKILNNETVDAADLLVPELSCALITVVALWFVTRKLRAILM